MSKKKRVLSIIIAAAMLTSVLSFAPAKRAGADEFYGLVIAGTRVTGDNYKNIFGDGTASYNPGTYTLNLKNFNKSDLFESGDYLYGIYAWGMPENHALVINVTGKNTLSTSHAGLYGSSPATRTLGIAARDLVIKGSGTLNIEVNGTEGGTNMGIRAAKLTVKNKKLFVDCAKWNNKMESYAVSAVNNIKFANNCKADLRAAKGKVFDSDKGKLVYSSYSPKAHVKGYDREKNKLVVNGYKLAIKKLKKCDKVKIDNKKK